MKILCLAMMPYQVEIEADIKSFSQLLQLRSTTRNRLGLCLAEAHQKRILSVLGMHIEIIRAKSQAGVWDQMSAASCTEGICLRIRS